MKDTDSLSRSEQRQLKQIEKWGFFGAIIFRSLLVSLASGVTASIIGLLLQFSEYDEWFYTLTLSITIPLVINPFIAYGNLRLVLKLQHAEKSARESLRIDALTGVYTREAFNDIVEIELENPAYYPVSLLFIDINDFKAVNDSYGHLVGDVILKSIAAQIQEKLRYQDMLARFGGDEFMVYLPRTSARVAKAASSELQQRIKTIQMNEHTQPLNLSVSIGIFTTEEPGMTLDEILEAADKAMYLEKEKK